jgi:PAS domain-containing protein
MRAALTPVGAAPRALPALYEQALDALATAVVVQDAARRVVYANTAA